MLYDIEPDSNVPIYEQIIAQITFGVAAGDLEVGSLIPSVRELSKQLIIAPATVARAYQELEKRGVLRTSRGKGMEVAAEAPRLCRAQRQDIVRERIREALREAASSALAPEEIRQLVEEELARVNGHRRPREKR
jgi:GntR family transcriptional regulator